LIDRREKKGVIANEVKQSSWINWIASSLMLLAMTFPLPLSAADAPYLGTDAEKATGKKLYEAKCAQCHGLKGDGKGIATPFLRPEPRDFTRAMCSSGLERPAYQTWTS